MSKLTKEQAVFCANAFSNYFDKFENVDDYMRDQKLNALAEKPFALPGMGPEEDLFSDFSVHPNDMEFELVEMPQERWNGYLEIISSHNNVNGVGKNIRLAILEKKTQKWIGFIRLGSPTLMMKPRNELLEQVPTSTPEMTSSFNNTTIMGFAIVPAQPFGYNYLGGKLLAGICCSHEVREMINKKYDMNACLFETTSLYGSSKSSSQYDGMKPFLRFKGLTDSNFLPMMNGMPYEKLRDYMESILGELVPGTTESGVPTSSRKLRTMNMMIGIIKNSLKDYEEESNKFNLTIENAKKLIERKRYYYSNYGFSNFKDVVCGKTDKLIPDKENYDKFYLENIINWWKKKASNRYETVKNENRLRTEIEVWTSGKEIDIIR
jgi:hypothetical protein